VRNALEELKTRRIQTKEKVVKVFAHIAGDYCPCYHESTITFPAFGSGTVTKRMLVIYGEKKRKANSKTKKVLDEVIKDIEKATEIKWSDSWHYVDQYIDENDVLVYVWPHNAEFELILTLPFTGEEYLKWNTMEVKE